jgi:hypothetical protein
MTDMEDSLAIENSCTLGNDSTIQNSQSPLCWESLDFSEDSEPSHLTPPTQQIRTEKEDSLTQPIVVTKKCVFQCSQETKTPQPQQTQGSRRVSKRSLERQRQSGNLVCLLGGDAPVTAISFPILDHTHDDSISTACLANNPDIHACKKLKVDTSDVTWSEDSLPPPPVRSLATLVDVNNVAFMGAPHCLFYQSIAQKLWLDDVFDFD